MLGEGRKGGEALNPPSNLQSLLDGGVPYLCPEFPGMGERRLTASQGVSSVVAILTLAEAASVHSSCWTHGNSTQTQHHPLGTFHSETVSSQGHTAVL